MNKVLIECSGLIDEYKLSKELIIHQLQNLKLNLNEPQYFVIAYARDFRFTMIGKIDNNKIILQYIEKAIDYRKMDNSDLFFLLEKMKFFNFICKQDITSVAQIM